MNIWLFSNQTPPKLYQDIAQLPPLGFVWIHGDYTEVPLILDKFERLTGIIVYEQHRQDCLNRSHPASFDTVKGYDLLILRSLAAFDVTTGIHHTVHTCFLISVRVLITITDQLPLFSDLENKLKTSELRLQFTLDNFLYYILKLTIDEYVWLRKSISSQLLLWQELFLDEKKRFENWRQLLAFKNQLRWLSTLMEEQQVVIEQWEADLASEMTDFMAVKIRDLQEHTVRALKMAAHADKELDSLIQLRYTILSRKTNNIMKTLTLISAIFLPLTLITGFFGMNFTHMPLLNTISGFYGVCIAITILPIVLILIFRGKHWL